MSNNNGRALKEKATTESILDQIIPKGSTALKPTEKEQGKLNALGTRWFAASQNLQRQQEILAQAQRDELEQRTKLLGVLEYVVEEHGQDFARLNWAFVDGRIILAIPK